MNRFVKNCYSRFSKLVVVSTTIVFLIVLSGWSGDLSKDELRDGKVVLKQDIQFSKIGLEQGTDVQVMEKSVNKPIDPIIRQYKVARESGDEAELKRLEKLIKQDNELTGESNGNFVVTKSTTVGYPGEPAIIDKNSGNSNILWTTDIHVRTTNRTFSELHPAMATASDGTIYCVWQNTGAPAPYDEDYLQIYYSTNNGLSWIAYGYLHAEGVDLREPSIAIGEGTVDSLLIAYIVDNQQYVPHVEVALCAMGSPVIQNFTIKSISYIAGWEEYRKPVIWTDSHSYSAWYAYLTAEGVYDSATDNVNITFWRSTNRGSTWTDHTTPLGNVDSDYWQDPDGTFGTSGKDLYIACFNATDNYLYTIVSLNGGGAWADTVQVAQVSNLPYFPVNPEIAAAINTNNIMLVCTSGSASSEDDIRYTYSVNGGSTWSTFWILPGYSTLYEFAPALHADEGGGSWHLVYTRNDRSLWYNKRPQDLSNLWFVSPDVVNDEPFFASCDYPVKAVTSNWNDLAGVTWADYRDGVPYDYDIYYDLNMVPVVGISPLSFSFSLNMGSGYTTQQLRIDNNGWANLEWNIVEQIGLLASEIQTTPEGVKANESVIDATTLPLTERLVADKNSINQILALGDTLRSMPTPSTAPWGIAWDGGNLWVACRGTNMIYQIDTANGSVLNSFGSPHPAGNYLSDLTFDGTYLWSTGYDQVINKINPTTGDVVKSFAAPMVGTGGIAFDGTDLWVSGFGSSVISRVDTSDGSVVGSIPVPDDNNRWGRGMVFDGYNLWIVNTNSLAVDMIYKVDPSDGTVLASFYPNINPTGRFPMGITTDGVYLWVTDFFEGLIYKIDPNSELDCTWLSESLTSGIVASGAYQNINVRADATGLAEGEYHCNLLINSNDPRNPQVVIPVELTIGPAVSIDDKENVLITKYELLQNYPNPFNPTTTIVYRLANTKPQQTTLKIYNSIGQLVRILVDEVQNNGEYTVTWDGLNSNGVDVSSGIYFYQLSSGDFKQTTKLLKMK